MTAVPVLTPTAQAAVQAPPPPENPPTQKDLAMALRFAHSITDASRLQDNVAITDEDVAKVHQYKTQVEAAMPAFHPLFEHITAFEKRMTEVMEREFRALGSLINEKYGRALFLAAKAHNKACHPGSVFGFEVVPFPDGTDPTQPPYNLPPLTSHKAVLNLTNVQRQAYFRGYCPVLGNTITATTELIFEAVGMN